MKLTTRIALAIFPTQVWDLIRIEWTMTRLRSRKERYERLCLDDPEHAFETLHVEAVQS